jgi:aminopeptidase N
MSGYSVDAYYFRFKLNEGQSSENKTLGWDNKALDIEQLMHCWITGPGFPVVRIERNYDSATASVTQVFIKNKY